MTESTNKRLCELGKSTLVLHIKIALVGVAACCLEAAVLQSVTTAVFCVLFFSAGVIVGRYFSALEIVGDEK